MVFTFLIKGEWGRRSLLSGVYILGEVVTFENYLNVAKYVVVTFGESLLTGGGEEGLLLGFYGTSITYKQPVSLLR